jgi:hypothetical protein
MATDNHSILLAASPDASIAEEEHPQASWAETAITVIAMVITVLIVSYRKTPQYFNSRSAN